MLKNNCNLVFVSRNGFDLIVFTLFDLSCRVIRVLCRSKYATLAIMLFPKL